MIINEYDSLWLKMILCCSKSQFTSSGKLLHIRITYSFPVKFYHYSLLICELQEQKTKVTERYAGSYEKNE